MTRTKRALLIGLVALCVSFATYKHCHWIPHFVWVYYNMPYAWKKGISGEAHHNLDGLLREAKLHFERTQQRSKNKETSGEFPCGGQGWICTPQKPPCALWNKNYYTNSPSLWEHPCWKKMKFIPEGSISHGQYCYRSDGVGKKATFTLTVTGAVQSCQYDSPTIVFKYMWYDEKISGYHGISGWEIETFYRMDSPSP